MKNFNLLYFSPTGGTRRVAEIFDRTLGKENSSGLCDITVECWNSVFGPDDTVIIFFPVYGGRVPAPMYERVEKLNGSNTRAVLVAVFGNRAVDDALLEMSDMLEARGFYTAAAAEIIAPHSLNPKIAAGRPDELDRKKINAFIQQLLEAPGDRAIAVPGNRPYVEYKGLPLKPVSGHKCSLCLVCQENCPAHAIPEEDPSKLDKDKCISCMRCVNICTTEVRRVPAALKLAAELSVKQMCSERKNPKFYI